MRKIVRADAPSLTEGDTLGRVVVFEDGSGLIQSFVPGKGWVSGGRSLASLFHAEDVSEKALLERGFSKEDVKEILADPTDTMIP